MFCNKCGANNRDGAKFCVSCGGALVAGGANYCPSCGMQNDASTRFCGNCGAPLTGASNVNQGYGAPGVNNFGSSGGGRGFTPARPASVGQANPFNRGFGSTMGAPEKDDIKQYTVNGRLVIEHTVIKNGRPTVTRYEGTEAKEFLRDYKSRR